jgi:CBS domain-containing protein
MPPKSALVRDYMSGKLLTFSPQTDVLDAIHQLVRHRIAGAPVIDDHGNLVGMLSELDCMMIALNAGYHGERGGPVAEYMTEETETVDADMSIIDLAQRFLESGFRRYPVVKDNRLIGQISRRDVLRALGEISAAGNKPPHTPARR